MEEELALNKVKGEKTFQAERCIDLAAGTTRCI